MNKTYEKEYSLEERVVSLLKQRGYTATTTESCTGGLLAGRLLNVAGASEVYKEDLSILAAMSIMLPL